MVNRKKWFKYRHLQTDTQTNAKCNRFSIFWKKKYYSYHLCTQGRTDHSDNETLAFTISLTKCQKRGLLEEFLALFWIFSMECRRGLLTLVRLWVYRKNAIALNILESRIFSTNDSHSPSISLAEIFSYS
jgi:hypothetical protein